MHKYFSKPWKMKHSHISHVAMLVYDLQRYHPDFVITIVDQVLEDFRRGLEHNIYTNNQRQMANIKYIGELYIYRVLGSSIIFDTLWSLTTFGHRKIGALPLILY
jgi:regulator of nonsense transcripts 2